MNKKSFLRGFGSGVLFTAVILGTSAMLRTSDSYVRSRALKLGMVEKPQKEETLFCELPEIVVENLAVWDDYDTDYTIFNVCGNDIRVYDDELAEALKQLSERNRETLLMYYFLEMMSMDQNDGLILDFFSFSHQSLVRFC